MKYLYVALNGFKCLFRGRSSNVISAHKGQLMLPLSDICFSYTIQMYIIVKYLLINVLYYVTNALKITGLLYGKKVAVNSA